MRRVLTLGFLLGLGACAQTTAGSDAASDVAVDAMVSLGAVTFRMQPPAGAAGDFYVTSIADPGDGDWWYSIARADGTPLRIFHGTRALLCGSCSGPPVPIGVGCRPLPADGVTATWDGAWYSESTCSGMACDATQYASAGRYIVTMCAPRTTGCLGAMGADANCVSVPFDYPATSAEVIGRVTQ